MTTLLHTETFGQGHPVVLLHGWAMNSQIWPKDILLKIPVQWILVDLPGHGQSSHIPLDKNLNAVLKRIEEVIPESAHVIGWSLGGMFTLALALKWQKSYQARGRHFGIICSSPKYSQSSEWKHAISKKTLSEFSSNLQRNALQTIKGFIALQFMNSPNAKKEVLKVQKQVLNDFSIDSESLQVGLGYLNNLDLRAECADIKQPITAFYGKLDKLVPIEAIEPIKHCFDSTYFNTIVSSTSGHTPFLNDPSLFTTFLKHVINGK